MHLNNQIFDLFLKMHSILSTSSDSNNDDDSGVEFADISRLRMLKKSARRAEKKAHRLRVQKETLKACKKKNILKIINQDKKNLCQAFSII